MIKEMIDFAYEPISMFKAKGEFSHGREPTLRRMPDGSLVSFLLTGGVREPDPDDGNVVAQVRSLDDGETWSAPEIVFSHPHLSSWGTEIFTGGGRPFAVFQTYRHATHYCELRSFMAYTDDSGKSWGAPFSLKGVPANFSVRQGKVLSDGSWIFPVYWAEQRGDWDAMRNADFSWPGLGGRQPDWQFVAGALVSRDRGQSFSLRGYLRDADQPAWEPEIVERGDGRLRMYIRTASGVLWESDSSDYGESWSPMRPGDIPNPGAKVVVYKVRGRHVMVNNVCSPASMDRKRLELWVSDDGCATWNLKLPLATILEGSPYGAVCYPHGFADDHAETLYLALDCYKEHFMLKVPYADLLRRPVVPERAQP